MCDSKIWRFGVFINESTFLVCMGFGGLWMSVTGFNSSLAVCEVWDFLCRGKHERSETNETLVLERNWNR